MNQEIYNYRKERETFELPEIQNFIKDIPLKRPSKKDEGPFSQFWYTINWRKIECEILKMQHEIFNNHQNCRHLQQTLVDHPFAKLYAIKQVAFTNQGRKTAGIDGLKKLTHFAGILLATRLNLDGKANIIRRVWIQKPGTKEKRPLGIPIIRDRAKQTLLKMAIEPQWEARFSGRTYGFRPGRRCHDAVWNIRNVLRTGARYIYDADLEKCFDKISHNYLIDKLGFQKSDIFTIQIRSWLKAGIMDPKEKGINTPKAGTAQGGTISPLLCNIALHGMETYVLSYLKEKKVRYKYIQIVKIYTYADDFIVLTNNKRVLFLCIKAINEFLTPIGLNIKKKKTRKLHTLNKAISHTIDLIESIDDKGNYIFDPEKTYLPVPYKKKVKLPIDNTQLNFLGYTFICFHVGRHKASKLNNKKPIFLNVWAIPSKDAIKRHFTTLRANLNKARNSNEVVTTLSPIINGWLEYYTKSDLGTAKKLGYLNSRLNNMLLKWQYRRYKTKRRMKQNWIKIKEDKWRFYTKIERKDKESIIKILPNYSSHHFSLIDYKPIKKESSIYDGNIPYWCIRLKSVLGLTPLMTKVLAGQSGKCPNCKKIFNIYDNPKLEKNPTAPKRKDGKTNKRFQYRIIHEQCH